MEQISMQIDLATKFSTDKYIFIITYLCSSAVSIGENIYFIGKVSYRWGFILYD